MVHLRQNRTLRYKIKKLLANELIEPVRGMGKGKYKFSSDSYLQEMSNRKIDSYGEEQGNQWIEGNKEDRHTGVRGC